MQKPDRSKLKYNEQKMKEAAKRPTLPYEPGRDWYPFVITDVEEKIGDTEKTLGDLVLVVRCAAVADIDRAGDPTVRLRPEMRERLTVPVGNPDYPGHEAPEYSYGLTEGFLLATFDENENDKQWALPRPPSRANGKLTFEGKEIKKDQEDDARAKVMKKSCDIAERLYFDNPKELKGRLFLGRIGPDRKGEGFTNILGRRHIDRGLPKNSTWGPAYKAGKGSTGGTSSRRRRPAKKKTAKKKKRSRR